MEGDGEKALWLCPKSHWSNNKAKAMLVVMTVLILVSFLFVDISGQDEHLMSSSIGSGKLWLCTNSKEKKGGFRIRSRDKGNGTTNWEKDTAKGETQGLYTNILPNSLKIIAKNYLINCSTLEEIKMDRILGRGSRKTVHLGHFRGMKVAVKTVSFKSQNLRKCAKEAGQIYVNCYNFPYLMALNDIVINSQLKHPGILQLLGACRKAVRPMLSFSIISRSGGSRSPGA